MVNFLAWYIKGIQITNKHVWGPSHHRHASMKTRIPPSVGGLLGGPSPYRSGCSTRCSYCRNLPRTPDLRRCPRSSSPTSPVFVSRAAADKTRKSVGQLAHSKGCNRANGLIAKDVTGSLRLSQGVWLGQSAHRKGNDRANELIARDVTGPISSSQGMWRGQSDHRKECGPANQLTARDMTGPMSSSQGMWPGQSAHRKGNAGGKSRQPYRFDIPGYDSISPRLRFYIRCISLNYLQCLVFNLRFLVLFVLLHLPQLFSFFSPFTYNLY